MNETQTDNFTFLFTTIAEAARRWEQQPTAMQAAVDRADALIRTVMTAHGGNVFQVIADAYCVAFRDAAAALSAAAEVQRQLANELPVKMAIHSGEVEVQGEHFFAPFVFNRIARILAVAHPGQILISTAAHAGLNELPADLSLRDMGERRLRDVGAEHLYQLVIADLSAEFPPLRTLDARSNNLPAMPTSFVGRELEQAAVRDLLRQPDVRLVTLTGMGGSGKTRLSLEVAADLLDEYADGVFFVPLAAITQPALVATAIAQTLGLREAGATTIADVLADYLANKQMLLVLDNFEQIVAAAPLLANLLHRAPLLKLLLTSRELLHLRDEHEYAVSPLPLPNLDQLAVASVLLTYPAVALFVQRAGAVSYNFRLDGDNYATVAAICHRLEGLPLAIELAAVRAREFTPTQMLAGLDDRFALLQSNYRDRTPRQRSLRGAIDWSYNLLSEGERLLFTRLAAFVGGCTLAAVEQVCNADADLPFSASAGMQSLIDKSLIQVVRNVDGDGRYVMLDTIREYANERLQGRYSMTQKSLREYAGEQLSESGEEQVIRERQFRFYLAMGKEADPKLRGPELAVWMNRLSVEHDNLRAALTWGLQHQREAAMTLMNAVWRFWMNRGYLTEGRHWLDLALADGEQGVDLAVWAKALNAAGGLARMQDELATAQHMHEQALQIFRRLGDKPAIAATTYSLAHDLRALKKTAAARQLYTEAVTLCTEVNDQPTLIAAYGNLGELALAEGDLDTARPILLANLARAHELGDPYIISQTTDDMARLRYEEGDYVAADGLVAEAVTVLRRIGFDWGLTHGLSLRAKIKTMLGDDEAALPLLTEVVTLRQQIGDKSGLAYGLNELAIIGVRRNPATARAAVEQFGFTAKLLADLSMTIESIQSDGYAEAIATCRTALSDAEFTQAWCEGEEMALEQAVEYALHEDKPIPLAMPKIPML